jgi:hypothetical protein
MNSSPISLTARFRHYLAAHFETTFWVVEYVIRCRAWWLAPLILALMLIGVGVFVAANPAVSPLIYALF